MKLWDLRKLRNFKTLSLGDQYQVDEWLTTHWVGSKYSLSFVVFFSQVKNLSFDLSGNYLAVAGTDVRYIVHSFVVNDLSVSVILGYT